MKLSSLGKRVRVARQETEARGETFYPGPSRIHLAAFPPKERWDDWTELDSRRWPQRVERHYTLIPTTCFNCESACGLLAYVDQDNGQIRKFEGNPEHPGSRGRNCAKGPATKNQVADPDRILHPLKRDGDRGSGKWIQVSWDEALDDISARLLRIRERFGPEAIAMARADDEAAGEDEPERQGGGGHDLVLIHDLFDTYQTWTPRLAPILARCAVARSILLLNLPGQAHTRLAGAVGNPAGAAGRSAKL